MYEPLVTIEERYGSQFLKIDYFQNCANVFVYDYSQRLPLLYSSTMSKSAANAFKEIFLNCGYIPVV